MSIEDGVLEKKIFKVEDYVNFFFDDSYFENSCNCSNVRYLEEKGKLMNLTGAEEKTCLRYSLIKTCRVKVTKVEHIVRHLPRDLSKSNQIHFSKLNNTVR